jgi:hypothetical protein
MPALPLDPLAEQWVQAALRPGEAVRWSSRPLPGASAARQAPSVLFGLGMLGLAGAGLASRQGSAPGLPVGPSGVIITGLLVLLAVAGVFVLVGPLRARAMARLTAYAVTSQRALLVTPRLGGAPQVEFFSAAALAIGEARPQADGSGDVALGTIVLASGRGQRRLQTRTIGFFAVPDAAEAFTAIRQLAGDRPPQPFPAVMVRPVWQKILFPVWAVVIGLATLFLGAQAIRNGQRSLAWPQAPGVVVSATKVRSGGRGVSFRAEIHYTYVVAGQSFGGGRVSFARTASGRRVDSILREYQPGTTVAVRYDPSRPMFSVLEPGVDPSAWLLPGIGWLLACFGGGLAWSYGSPYRLRPVVRRSVFAF